MCFRLTDEQRDIQQMTPGFAQEKIAPRASEWDRDGVFPRDHIAEFAELGLMGACIPEEYGGAGADSLSYILMLEELSRADAGVGGDGGRADLFGHLAHSGVRFRSSEAALDSAAGPRRDDRVLGGSFRPGMPNFRTTPGFVMPRASAASATGGR